MENIIEAPLSGGGETFEISNTIINDVKKEFRNNKSCKLYMAGHSRGGASIIHAAKLLDKEGYEIECMYLYDAVNKTFSEINTDTISKNVKMVYHARRNTNLSNRYEGDLDRSWQSYFNCVKINAIKNVADSIQASGIVSPALTVAQLAGSSVAAQFQCAREIMHVMRMERLDNAMKIRARREYGVFPEKIPQSRGDILRMWTIDFENCGLKHINGDGFYEECIFDGSHGAIGGAYIGDENSLAWSDDDRRIFVELIARDKVAKSLVKKWMWNKFEDSKLINHIKT